MANPDYGVKTGPSTIVTLPVKSANTWENGDFLVLSSGYLAVGAAGGSVFGVAVGDVPTAGSADGDLFAEVEVNEDALLYYPVGTGTMTQAMAGKTCDIGGAASLDVTASTDDCIYIVRPDVTNNAAWCRLNVQDKAAGVV